MMLVACFIIQSTWFVSTAQAQIKNVHGTLFDEMGELVGASVCEIDNSGRIIEATVTDLNGNFSMPIRNPKDKLRFSYVGCKTKTLPIDRDNYKVTLESENTLEDVVIVADRRLNGGGLAIPEREISYATQTIDMKEFEGLGLTTVDEALQGRVAGLDIVANSGNLGAGTTMRLRGASSISTLTSSNPLIVVNGNTWNVDMNNFDVNNANDEQFAQLLLCLVNRRNPFRECLACFFWAASVFLASAASLLALENCFLPDAISSLAFATACSASASRVLRLSTSLGLGSASPGCGP